MTVSSERTRLELKYPASWWKNMWREALPSGNGTMGVSVYGAVQEETVLINHADLWHWGRKDPLPDVSHTLAQTRKLMDEGRYLEASWNLTNALKEQGYAAKLASTLPLGDIKLRMPCQTAFSRYRRSLQMDTGEVTVSWKDGDRSYVRNLFVSRADDLIVYEVKSPDGPVNGTLWMGLHPTDKPRLIDQVQELRDTVETEADGLFVRYAGRNEDETDFGAVARLIPKGGQVVASGGELRFTDCEHVLILVKTFVRGRRKDDWARLQAELAGVNAGYAELLEAHLRLHQPLFRSAALRLGAEEAGRSNEELLLEAYEGEAPTQLVEKMWHYGRYLFISGTRAQGQPFRLYGLWGGDYDLTWCHHMANENTQMMYWHAAVGGLMELIPPMFDYFESMMDEFRNNARKLYGCDGIYIPAGSTPGIGVPNQIVPVIMNWTGAAGWLAQHYYEYYQYTGDREFLKGRVLPFMREVARFYEDFLIVGEDGYYKFYPSVSPENTPQNFMPTDGKPLAHPMPTTINATMDFAILKELLAHLLAGSRDTGMYSEHWESWSDMLSRIPPYQLNEDGAIREWMNPTFDDRYDHRHLSHIYPIFPGKEFVREEDPELFQAFETAVKLRLIGAQSGWSLAHMSSIYARLGDGNNALGCLDILSRACLLNNFFTLHNDWRSMGVCMNMQEAPIQMDANLGWINAVQEMLLYSSPEHVKLLPALPTKWNEGTVERLRYGYGTLSFIWNREEGCLSADIYAERDGELTLTLPDFGSAYSVTGEGISVEDSPLGPTSYRVSLKQGQTLIIRTM
jgi:alpha-L-fucosidase 2